MKILLLLFPLVSWICKAQVMYMDNSILGDSTTRYCFVITNRPNAGGWFANIGGNILFNTNGSMTLSNGNWGFGSDGSGTFYGIVALGVSNSVGLISAVNGGFSFNGTPGTDKQVIASANGRNVWTNYNAADLSGTLADARLSANVALLNANQTFSGSNAFYSGSATSNNLFSLYGADGKIIANANGTNDSFEVKSNLVFGAQKQYWRPSQVSGYESYTISARQGDGTLANIESSSFTLRPNATGNRSMNFADTGAGGPGLSMVTQMRVSWSPNTSDYTVANDTWIDRNGVGILGCNGVYVGTNGFFSIISNASPVITITLPTNDANNATMWTNNFGASGVLAFQGATAARMDSGTIAIAQTAWKQWPMMVTTAGSIPLRANETVSITNTIQPTLVTFKFAP